MVNYRNVFKRMNLWKQTKGEQSDFLMQFGVALRNAWETSSKASKKRLRYPTLQSLGRSLINLRS